MEVLGTNGGPCRKQVRIQLQRDHEPSRLERESLTAAYLKLMPLFRQSPRSAAEEEGTDHHTPLNIAIGG